jgi:transcriptional regulator GlxA family with amidase domain
MERRISLVKEKILSAPNNNWTTENLAKEVNLCKSQFEKLFYQEVKQSPIQYIRHLRFEKAKELLETTFLSIKEICIKVGFNDQSHFVRDFKKKYGKTPTEYRKFLSDENQNRQ